MNELEDQDETIEFEEPEFDALGGQPLTDETITQEQINEMKMLGMDKPKGVTWERWQRIKTIRHEHEHMVHLVASGLTQAQIAKILGYDQQTVSRIMLNPVMKEKVRQQVQEIYGVDHKKALKDRTMKAMQVVDTVLTSGKETEQASMAKWVIEHSVGKASQDIQVTKTTLSEVIVKIEEMKANQLRDIGSNASSLPKPIDPFDTIINEVIPKDLVIGKRSSSGGETE